MNKKALGADALLLLTACIWGFGFTAQRSGMEYIGPFAFNGIRFLLGSLSLFPLIFLRSRHIKNNEVRLSAQIKDILPGAFIAGNCIFIAVTLQQIGIMFTTAGNAGFITGLYVALVPVLGFFLGRKTGPVTWLGAIFTLAGLYFISTAGKPDKLNPGDMLVAVSAIFWAMHVLLIDRLVKKSNPIILSSGQFLVCGIYSLAAAFLAEPFLAGQLRNLGHTGLFEWTPFTLLLRGLYSGIIPLELAGGAVIPILYGGLASVGIAYTLQVIAQKNAPPAHATIILCFEGCFAALGGIILLNETLGVFTLLGFILMLSGMFASQWELIFSKSHIT